MRSQFSFQFTDFSLKILKGSKAPRYRAMIPGPGPLGLKAQITGRRDSRPQRTIIGIHRSTFLLSLYRHYFSTRRKGSEILIVFISYQKKVIYGKKSVTRPPLHIALCYNSRWNGPISNFLSFWATERLFISKWGRISPESDWCWFKLVLGSSSLLLRGYMNLSPAVGHIRECPHSGTRYCQAQFQ